MPNSGLSLRNESLALCLSAAWIGTGSTSNSKPEEVKKLLSQTGNKRCERSGSYSTVCTCSVEMHDSAFGLVQGSSDHLSESGVRGRGQNFPRKGGFCVKHLDIPY
ncbi:unnamed protein product [Calypogeia fissa]